VQVIGTGLNGGTINLSEQWLNSANDAVVENVNLSGTGSLSQVYTFSSVNGLDVSKDQADFPITGQAFSSQLTDAFSQTPLPGTLPLLATGFVVLWGVRRKRKQNRTQGRLQSALS
jgi:hypothetical protein